MRDVQPEPAELIRHRLAVLDELLSLRRQGVFYAVWCDDWKLRVQYGQFEDRVPLKWSAAEEITGLKPMVDAKPTTWSAHRKPVPQLVQRKKVSKQEGLRGEQTQCATTA